MRRPSSCPRVVTRCSRTPGLAVALLVACGGGADGEKAGSAGEDSGPDAPVGVAALGGGTGDPAAVRVDVMATADDGLATPRDLAFNPEVDGQLWVVNRDDDSVTLLQQAGTDDQTIETIVDPYALHFLDSPSSLDFGKPGHWGSCQESRNTYNDRGPPNEFMGPTLWSSDLEVFGTSNPEAVEYLSDLYGFYVDLGSHLDMLHESPLCMGIAWETENVYWVFDGYNESIVRYDFVDDHGVGYDDHSDGVIRRYAEGEVGYVEGVPAHMHFDGDARLLYLADPGNNRVAVLDIESGDEGRALRVQEPGTDFKEVTGSSLWTLIDGESPGLEQISGLARVDDLLLVSDAATGTLAAFDLEGNEVDRLTLDLPPGALMGVEARGQGEIWVVDGVGHRLLRLTPADGG